MNLPAIRSKLKTFCLRGLKWSGILLAALALGYAFLPKPDLLPGGYSLYPGETVAVQIPPSIYTSLPPRPQQYPHGPPL